MVLQRLRKLAQEAPKQIKKLGGLAGLGKLFGGGGLGAAMPGLGGPGAGGGLPPNLNDLLKKK